LSGARCKLFALGPTDATAIPKHHHLLPHLNPDWFYLSGSGLPRLSWKKRPLNGRSSSSSCRDYTDHINKSLVELLHIVGWKAPGWGGVEPLAGWPQNRHGDEQCQSPVMQFKSQQRDISDRQTDTDLVTQCLVSYDTSICQSVHNAARYVCIYLRQHKGPFTHAVRVAALVKIQEAFYQRSAATRSVRVNSPQISTQTQRRTHMGSWNIS